MLLRAKSTEEYRIAEERHTANRKQLFERLEQVSDLEDNGVISESLPTEVAVKRTDEAEGVYEINNDEEIACQQLDTENRASFLERLNAMTPEEIQTVEFAYDLAKEAHRPQFRDTGERYFEHVRKVALILMDECGVKNPNIIISALLHDSVEDSALFGNGTKAYSEWQKKASFRLTKVFNRDVAQMVVGLTKPSVDGAELRTKDEAHHFYLENLKAAPPEVMLVKMSDRLHNLRSLAEIKPQKVVKILRETTSVYLPIFETAKTTYPNETAILIGNISKVITEVEKRLVERMTPNELNQLSPDDRAQVESYLQDMSKSA